MRLSSLALLLPAVLACNPEHLARQANATESFKFTAGDDGPADVATMGYFVNHVALLVSNMTATREWYSNVLGMRHIFTVDVSEYYQIMYMGHSQGGRNGTGFQSGAEMNRDKNNMAGLMEFQTYKPHAATKKFTPGPKNTLSHMGLIVPDLAIAQARFDELGVTTLKRHNEMDVFNADTGNEIVAGAWGFDDFRDPETQKHIQEGLVGIGAIGFKDFIIIADPDGNLYEVQSLVPSGI